MLFNSPEKIVVNQLVYDLQHRPEDFRCTDAALRDTKAGIVYAVGCAWFDSGIDSPFKMNFGCIHGWRFFSAVRKWKAWKVIQETTKHG